MTFKDFIINLIHHGLERFGKFYSAYRGYVTDNEDPDGLHRIKVNIPSLTQRSNHTKWVYPRGVFSGEGYGSQLLPQVGDMVWVEFEHGDPEFPIWSHAHYIAEEKPEEFVNSKVYGFKSPEGQIVIIDDRDGEVYISLERCDGSLKDYLTELIAFNHGENGGLVKVKQLTCKLNNIEDKINDILAHYDSHVHIDPISGYTGPPSPPLAGSDSVTPRPINIALTDQDYIENDKVLH